MMKQGARPKAAITAAAMAGPMMRARLTRVEYSVTALRRCSGQPIPCKRSGGWIVEYSHHAKLKARM